jgi:hypothetical protein
LEADDYRPPPRLAAVAPRRAGIPVWAYCLMPNHVHLACAGGRGWVAGDLCRGAPARYRGDQHRFRWTGHLFQGRFGAVVMDKPRLLAAAGYIALNPMVAGLVSRSSLAIVEQSGAARGRGRRVDDGGAVARADLRFCGSSRDAGRHGGDDPDRAGPRHRPPAGEAGMDHDARAPARLPFGTPQPGPKPRVEPDTARPAQLP